MLIPSVQPVFGRVCLGACLEGDATGCRIGQKELVPTKRGLLPNQDLYSRLRELVKGEGGVVNPTINASNEDASKNFSSFESGTARAEGLVQGGCVRSLGRVTAAQEIGGVLKRFIAGGIDGRRRTCTSGLVSQ